MEPYTEEYDATDDGNVCPQYDIGSGSPVGDEDCLNVNVYTPKIDDKKRAVMVYFHGGGKKTHYQTTVNYCAFFLRSLAILPHFEHQITCLMSRKEAKVFFHA